MNDQTRNPYFGEDGAPRLVQSVVAFVDILGYKDMVLEAIKDNYSVEFLTRLSGAINEVIEFLHEGNKNRNSVVDLYRVKVFTDNIVIGYPILKDAELELIYIFMKLGVFQLEMLKKGFFVRGGIAIGDLYMDDNIVYGQGLINAYDAENKKARDPRIVLDSTAVEKVETHVEKCLISEFSPHNMVLLKDADGQMFVNYLYNIRIKDDLIYMNNPELALHKEVVESRLSKYKGSPNIWSKYSWAAVYHNYVCAITSVRLRIE